MFEERELSPGVTSVLSAGELGFQRVLDRFADAKRVAVLTYNFAKSGGSLMRALALLGPDVRLDIITNIPSRWGSYFGQSARKKAEQAIRDYLSRLDPLEFTAHTTIRFNLQNHAKLIATDACAYIGSANFSDESANSVELGIIITDPHAVAAALEMFDAVAGRSVLRPGEEAFALQLALRGQAKRLERLNDELALCFYKEADHHWAGQAFYFDPEAVSRETMWSAA